MQKIKNYIKIIIGIKNINLFLLLYNYFIDFILYIRHSSVFSINTFNKKESEITLLYHSIEKGFLHDPLKFYFAKDRVIKLINYLKDEDILKHIEQIQIQAAIINLINYYEYHKSYKIDISFFFDEATYERLKSIIKQIYSSKISHDRETYFFNYDSDFKTFSNSRKSVRSFTGDLIPIETIQNVINLANNYPSVCNRQAISVYLIQNKTIINKIFEIQGGLKGFTTNVSQIIVLVGDRNYFYSIGERNQLFIDGGIYLMNLLYSFHYYKIATCPAHWGMSIKQDNQIKNILNLQESLKVISLISIGIPNNSFNTTLSLRRKFQENLFVIK